MGLVKSYESKLISIKVYYEAEANRYYVEHRSSNFSSRSYTYDKMEALEKAESIFKSYIFSIWEVE